MKKNPPPSIRPQDAMARFDRLLATMAPKRDAKRPAEANPGKRRGPKPRKRA